VCGGNFRVEESDIAAVEVRRADLSTSIRPDMSNDAIFDENRLS
jgi:hypothetical protein